MNFQSYIAFTCRVFLLYISSFSFIARGEFDAGCEYDVLLPESRVAMKVYLPVNYDVSHKWPLVVFYHGMNGSPTTECIKRHCNGEHFIVAGLTYCEKLDAELTRAQHNAYIDRERQNFRNAVSWVKLNLSLDINRVFLGGVSKGGWATSFIGERELNNLAGFIILLAGRQRGAVPGPQKMPGFPVYIGSGENDPNITSAAQASAFYRHCGAAVTFEEYEGVGHQVPQNGRMLSLWLKAYGYLSHPWLEPEEKAKYRSRFKEQYKRIVSMTDKSAACAEMKALIEDPCLLVVCGAGTCSSMASELSKLSKSSSVAARELYEERLFYNTAWNEWQMKTVDDTSDVINGYSKLKNSDSGSRWTVYATKSYDRLIPVYHSALRQMQEMQPENKTVPQNNSRSRFGNSGRMGGVSF